MDLGPHRVARALRADLVAAGDRVTHERFGLGTVVSADGVGAKADATIDFGSSGIKRLLLRYAPVEKL